MQWREKPAARYHLGVSHTREGLSGWTVDWTNPPEPHKRYDVARRVDLPLPAGTGATSLGGALSERPPTRRSLGLGDLAELLFAAHGVIRVRRQALRDMIQRTAPSAGALYPCELYVLVRDVVGLEPGLYHHDPLGNTLEELGSGWGRVEDLGLSPRGEVEGGEAAVICLGAVFARSAWKYRERAYRYVHLDAGHVIEGLTLAASALGLSWRVEVDFADAAANAFLGLDGQAEACLAVARIFSSRTPLRAPDGARVFSGLGGGGDPAGAERVPAVIRDIHLAGSKPFPASPPDVPSGVMVGELTPKAIPEPIPDVAPLWQAVRGRRSRRNFTGTPLPGHALGNILSALCAPLYPGGQDIFEQACQVAALVRHSESLATGLYLLKRKDRELVLVRREDFFPGMARACLDQLWVGGATMLALFLVDLAALEGALGPRGYRLALQNAGRLGHRVYLAASSLGVGACGVAAMFDGEAAALLGLPESTRLLYLVAAGAAAS